MLGAIAGDIIGSVHEYSGTKTLNFPLFIKQSNFTDDTVLTVAVAESVLHRFDYAVSFKRWFWRYPESGYGGRFCEWAMGGSLEPYNSFGNGSAMRVSPVAYAFDKLEVVLLEAKRSAAATHNHPEGVKGAQATAAAMFLARTGANKEEIKEYIEKTFGYSLNESIDSLRKYYNYDVTCQGTVPPAIRAFLESENYEDAVRKAISLGGDADTLACITGGLAEAFYKGIPDEIEKEVWQRLDARLKAVIEKFRQKYCDFSKLGKPDVIG